MRNLLIVACLALFAAAPASAQVMPTQVVRRGAPNGLELSDGEPISFYLEHARMLDLTDEQRAKLIEIRRRLRADNAPFMRQLDSLRDELGISMEPQARLSEQTREKLAKLEVISRPITDSIRLRNDAAAGEARRMLDSLQVVRADSLILAERNFLRGRRPPPPSSRLRG